MPNPSLDKSPTNTTNLSHTASGEGNRKEKGESSSDTGRLPLSLSIIGKDSLDLLDAIFYSGGRDVAGYWRLPPAKTVEFQKIEREKFIDRQRKRANEILNWCDTEEVRL